MTTIAIALTLLLSATAAQGQTWSELQNVPRQTSVRVFEAAGKGWTFADGKLLLVRDDELTILKSGRPLVIPRHVISIVEARRRDRPIEGALIGALTNVVAGGVLGGWQGCSSGSSCVVVGISVWAGIGALIDWQIRENKIVYRAP